MRHSGDRGCWGAGVDLCRCVRWVVAGWSTNQTNRNHLRWATPERVLPNLCILTSTVFCNHRRTMRGLPRDLWHNIGDIYFLTIIMGESTRRPSFLLTCKLEHQKDYTVSFYPIHFLYTTNLPPTFLSSIFHTCFSTTASSSLFIFSI